MLLSTQNPRVQLMSTVEAGNRSLAPGSDRDLADTRIEEDSEGVSAHTQSGPGPGPGTK